MNHSSRPLLCRSQLWPDESLPSLLIRLAKENCYHSSAMVAHVCRERLPQRDQITQPVRAETYQALAELTTIGADELYAACVQRFAPTLVPPDHEQHSILLSSGKTVCVSTKFVLREHTRPESDAQFCPLCLKESAHHRVGWFPLAIAVCLRHQCSLVHSCPTCQERISVRDILEIHCPNCGFELTQAPVTSVAADSFGLLSQSVIQSWLGLRLPTSVNDYEPLPVESPASLYRLMDGMRRAVMSVRHSWDYLYLAPSGVGSPLFPCTSKSDITPAKAYILYATAFKAMVSWPRGLYDFLDAYKLRDGQSPNGQLRRDLGHIYFPWLQRLWRHPTLQFAQEAFGKYLLDS